MSTYTEIDTNTAISFILPKHYSGRKPHVKYAFGEYKGNDLVAVCIFGIPATQFLCTGVCGPDMKDYVVELNRLCRVDNYDGILSQFVAWCLKQIGNKIVVSYSDTAMNHHGYIYQALNFLYTGCTKERTDMYYVSSPEKHPRHISDYGNYRQIRSPKHRYVLFVGSKKFKREMKKLLKYPIEKYPKGDNNENYKLGDFLKPIVVDENRNIIELKEKKMTKIDEFF